MEWNFRRNLEDDGLYLPSIKEHSFQKFQKHNTYARIFASGMKNVWPQRAYIGLYCGAGRARVEPSGEIVETTAMSVLQIPHPFDKYVFVDSDARCTAALQARIDRLSGRPSHKVITGDVKSGLKDVVHELPRFSKARGLLSLCFVDPFAFDVDFEVIRTLANFKMDFLILLILGTDVRRNFVGYYERQEDDRIGRMIDCPTWRAEYDKSTERDVVRFVHGKFEEAMVRLKYRPLKPGHHQFVRVRGTGAMQYDLVLYSRHPLAQKFWGSSNPDRQLGLFPE